MDQAIDTSTSINDKTFSYRLRKVGNVMASILVVGLIVLELVLARIPDADCVRLLRGPLIFLGVIIALNMLNLILCFLGLGGHIDRKWLPYIHAFMFVAVLFLVFLLLFTFHVNDVGTNNSGGETYHLVEHEIPIDQAELRLAKLIDESTYKLEDFTSFLKKDVKNSKIWGQIKDCIESQNICQKMDQQITTLDYFLTNFNDITTLQKGCCIPLPACALYPIFDQNGIVKWAAADGSSNACLGWSTSTYCYECDSCRASFLATVNGASWTKVSRTCIIIAVVAIFISLIVLSVSMNAEKRSTTGTNPQV